MSKRLLFYVDGASRGNPGESGYGVYVSMAGKKAVEIYGYLGHATNNQAEYAALLAALQFARREGAARVSVRSDSELLVKQVKGLYRVKDETLRRMHARALALIEGFEAFDIAHVPREKNKRADKLANLAVKTKASSPSAKAPPAVAETLPF